jgi:hypothetical protein
MAMLFPRQNSTTVLQPCKTYGLLIQTAKPSHTARTLCEILAGDCSIDIKIKNLIFRIDINYLKEYKLYMEE